MNRLRLTATALLILAAMPGCHVCNKERPCFPRINAWLCGNKDCPNTAGYGYGDFPAGAPVMTGGTPVIGGGAPGCDNCAVGGVPGGPPVISGPVPGGGMMPVAPTPAPPTIPKAGIKESDGKQFELEGASKMGSGPVLAVPAGGSKGR